jgi:MarR family transcriptional regulator, organic hydroperoxide resistance regulator
LLQRAPNPTDSRARQLQLTPAGQALVAAALTDVEAADDDYFAALGSRQDAFVEALNAVCAAGRA